MEKFLKKKWHSIPVGIMSAVLLVCLLAGSAFAWYAVSTSTAEVTVEEAIAYTVTGGDGTFDVGSSVWTVPIYPGEMKVLYMTVSNASSADLAVVAVATGVPAHMDVTGNNGIPLAQSVIIPGGGSGPFSVELYADGEIVPDTYTITVTLQRAGEGVSYP